MNPFTEFRSSNIIWLLVTFVIAYIVYQLVRLLLYVRKLKADFKGAPGLKTHWLYGNMHLLPKTCSEDRLKVGLGCVNKYKRYYVWWMSTFKASISVCHPDTVKKVMKSSEPKPTGFGGLYRLALPWLGEGLLISGGERWARARKLLTPAFHFDILKPYITVYNDAADILVENLGKFESTKSRFEVFRYMSKCTFDIILRCAFSYQTNCQTVEGDVHPYVRAVEALSLTWNYRARTPWMYFDSIFYLTQKGREFRRNCDFVHKVAEDVINQRREALTQTSDEPKRKYLDFLDILLTARDAAGVGLTPIEIRNEVDTFLFEGHDTTASALSWILYALAIHPECQRKCQAEIDAILDGKGTDNIEWEDLSRLDYLTMCIKEGMRQYSPVPFIQREFTHDFELDGHTFPAGTSVSLHIYGLHHNEHVWDRPMEYNPERFSKENVSKMDTFQFVPFSAGPRNCIGQHFAMNEEKVVLAKLLRKFWFEVDPTHEVKLKVAAVMRAEDGIYMYAKRR